MASGRSTTFAVLSVLVAALLAGLYMTLPQFQAFFVLPMINDISTDLDDPPQFLHLDVPPYPDANASVQRDGYPDLAGIVLPAPPAEAFERARDAAIDLDWRIGSADAPGEDGNARLEAVATTPLFRFRDDVVVRLRAEGDGTRIDLRSRSRIGRHDLGANARRIRDFLDRVQR